MSYVVHAALTLGNGDSIPLASEVQVDAPEPLAGRSAIIRIAGGVITVSVEPWPEASFEEVFALAGRLLRPVVASFAIRFGYGVSVRLTHCVAPDGSLAPPPADFVGSAFLNRSSIPFESLVGVLVRHTGLAAAARSFNGALLDRENAARLFLEAIEGAAQAMLGLPPEPLSDHDWARLPERLGSSGEELIALLRIRRETAEAEAAGRTLSPLAYAELRDATWLLLVRACEHMKGAARASAAGSPQD